VFHVLDLDGHVDARLVIAAGARFHGGDVGVDIGYLGADFGEHPLAVFHLHRQTNGVRCLIGAVAVPFNVDPAVGLEHQIEHIRTGRRMH
jgi:hypothetical protein